MRGEYTLDLMELSGYSVIRVTGAVHLLNGERFRADLEEIEVTQPVVVLELSGLDYLDSNALVCLLSLHERFAKEKIALVLVSPSPFVRKMIEITRLSEILPVFATLPELESAIHAGRVKPLPPRTAPAKGE